MSYATGLMKGLSTDKLMRPCFFNRAPNEPLGYPLLGWGNVTRPHTRCSIGSYCFRRSVTSAAEDANSAKLKFFQLLVRNKKYRWMRFDLCVGVAVFVAVVSGVVIVVVFILQHAPYVADLTLIAHYRNLARGHRSCWYSKYENTHQTRDYARRGPIRMIANSLTQYAKAS